MLLESINMTVGKTTALGLIRQRQQKLKMIKVIKSLVKTPEQVQRNFLDLFYSASKYCTNTLLANTLPQYASASSWPSCGPQTVQT